ncbi:PIN-like domain-containing protein [Nonomuraea bangladeshensis]|uniref:PIN-like domain-containing protein n=1 Tax=Nonomuraea bangladeshensis TaxID=404385 RepID=UPI003C2EDBEF
MLRAGRGRRKIIPHMSPNTDRRRLGHGQAPSPVVCPPGCHRERSLLEAITTELGNMLDDAFVAVSKRIKDVMDKESSELSRITHEDPVLEGLEPIIEGRRGEPFPPALYQELVQEALDRIEKQVPSRLQGQG